MSPQPNSLVSAKPTHLSRLHVCPASLLPVLLKRGDEPLGVVGRREPACRLAPGVVWYSSSGGDSKAERLRRAVGRAVLRPVVHADNVTSIRRA
jgi:hypothetical protein